MQIVIIIALFFPYQVLKDGLEGTGFVYITEGVFSNQIQTFTCVTMAMCKRIVCAYSPSD